MVEVGLHGPEATGNTCPRTVRHENRRWARHEYQRHWADGGLGSRNLRGCARRGVRRLVRRGRTLPVGRGGNPCRGGRRGDHPGGRRWRWPGPRARGGHRPVSPPAGRTGAGRHGPGRLPGDAGPVAGQARCRSPGPGGGRHGRPVYRDRVGRRVVRRGVDRVQHPVLPDHRRGSGLLCGRSGTTTGPGRPLRRRGFRARSRLPRGNLRPGY